MIDHTSEGITAHSYVPGLASLLSLLIASCLAFCLLSLGLVEVVRWLCQTERLLPRYSIERLEQGICEPYAAAAATVVLRVPPDSLIEIVLRPKTPVTSNTRVYAEAWLNSQSGLHPWPFRFYRTETGSLLGQGSSGALRGAPTGEQELVILLGSSVQALERLRKYALTRKRDRSAQGLVVSMPIYLLPPVAANASASHP